METGEITLEGAAAELAHNPEVRRAYLGKGGPDTPVPATTVNRPLSPSSHEHV